MGVFHHIDDLGPGLGQHHHQRLLGIGGQCVAIEDLAAGGIVHHPVGHDIFQRGNDFIAAGENGLVGRRQFHGVKTLGEVFVTGV